MKRYLFLPAIILGLFLFLFPSSSQAMSVRHTWDGSDDARLFEYNNRLCTNWSWRNQVKIVCRHPKVKDRRWRKLTEFTSKRAYAVKLIDAVEFNGNLFVSIVKGENDLNMGTRGFQIWRFNGKKWKRIKNHKKSVASVSPFAVGNNKISFLYIKGSITDEEFSLFKNYKGRLLTKAIGKKWHLKKNIPNNIAGASYVGDDLYLRRYNAIFKKEGGSFTKVFNTNGSIFSGEVIFNQASDSEKLYVSLWDMNLFFSKKVKMKVKTLDQDQEFGTKRVYKGRNLPMTIFNGNMEKNPYAFIYDDDGNYRLWNLKDDIDNSDSIKVTLPEKHPKDSLIMEMAVRGNRLYLMDIEGRMFVGTFKK